jgi:AcrR family transcriptional regulator
MASVAEAALAGAPGSWSIAAVAEALEVSPQAVYRLVANADELLVAVIDHVVADGLTAPVREDDADVATYLAAVGRRVGHFLEGVPGVASAAVGVGWLGSTPALDRFLESCLEQLVGSGLDPVDANIGLDLLLDWTVGWVSRHETAMPAGEADAPIADAPTDAVPTPLLDRARLDAPTREVWFERQLAAVAAGIVVQFAAPPVDRRL